MSFQAPILIIAEGKAPDLVAALTAALAHPLVEARPGDVPAVLAAVEPAAIVLADPDPVVAGGLAVALARQADPRGPYVPIIGRVRDGAALLPFILPIAADAPTAKLVARLSAALRVRSLEARVLRRNADSAAKAREPLDDATVLVTGRGGSYPALAVAIGEWVGLIGALSLDQAKLYLEARDIDGLVIGDGFNARAVEAFLDALAADARFRDLPIVLVDRNGAVDLDELCNAERVKGDPEQVLARLAPLTRLHAFAARLRREIAGFDSEGLDVETGLMHEDAYLRELSRIVNDVRRRASLSVARISFDRPIDRRISLDAARIVGRLVRASDFACLAEDGILIAFGDTALKNAHVIARRIASVLRHTMLAPHGGKRLDPTVALAVLKGADTVASLMGRVRPAPIAAE